jgi:DNA-binding transcriptional MerR regulator
MAEKDRFGGVGKIRDLGEFDANRRMTPLPGISNVPGMPGNNFSAEKTAGNPTPFNSKLGKGRKKSDQLIPSNLGKLIKGEVSSAKVKDPNTGATTLMRSGDFNETKSLEYNLYKAQTDRTGSSILPDTTNKFRPQSGRWGRFSNKKPKGVSRGFAERQIGPIDPAFSGYEKGLGTNPGEIEGVKLQAKQQNPEFAGDPSGIQTKSNFFRDENAYGKINVLIRDKKRQITDRVAVNKGKNRQEIRQTIDPKQVVETIDKDPDNPYITGRFEEKTLGKKMREASNEFKTPTIGRTVLEDYYRQGRFTPLSKMSPDQIEGVGINPAKVGTFAGVIDMGKIETSTTPLGNQQNKELQRLVYAAKGSDGDVLKTKRTIPAVTKDDPIKYFMSTAEERERTKTVPEQLFRIDNPQAYDVNKTREAVAPFVGMQMKGEPTKEARKSISIDQVKELQKKGYTFRRVTEDGSRAVMLPPMDKNAPPMSVNDRLTQEINLTYDARSNRYFLNKEYATYEVGPTAFLTKPGTRVQRTRTGELRTGDVPDAVRKVAERQAPVFPDVVAGFDQIKKETIKSDSAPLPQEVTSQGRKYIADQIVRAKELGYSNDQVQQLLDITPAGSAARKDLVNAIVERYQEVSPYAARREIDLFDNSMTPLDRGTKRLRELLEQKKRLGEPVNREQLYGLADLIGKREAVSGVELINESGRIINEKTRYLSAAEKQEIVNYGLFGNGTNGYQVQPEELALDKVGKDPIYTRGRGDVTTNKPELMPTRMPYDLVGEVPSFSSPIPAEVAAIRAMAQADPTQQAGSVETSKTSMLNAPREQPMYGPVGQKPEEKVIQNRAYTDTIQVKNYAQMARFLGREVGDPMQEKAMAAMAQRIAARLRR